MEIYSVLDLYSRESLIDAELVARLNRTYPGYPEIAPFKTEPYENLHWYYNANEGWGCWIQNEYQRPMVVPEGLNQAVFFPLNEDDPLFGQIYRSPVPLHKADVPNSFRAHMTWYINYEGWGQYVYLSRIRDASTGRYTCRHVLITRGNS
mgnify:CR=1 FL=1